MKDNTKLIRVFSGTELIVNLLKDELENFGISSLVKNDFNSGISAGFSGGFPSSIDLFIQEPDTEKAKPIISAFIETNS